ncbi:O-antigen ligase family protein [Maribacter sp. HTCC2170]|uniref:O-antigen ligase family protein n=1 Tax=Maribacter sp. (strain HTCC2170 / KCCM 42371) TaxID=313603 RepID=UPI00006BD3BA|nr:O-antigen ligase family protein [Maribacter sp. HTCC2170]EAR02768.1 hypothetical protein FB2170_05755 [Maribacter sp. HTCC2170]
MSRGEKLYLFSLCVLAFSLCFDPDWSSKSLIFVGIVALFNLKIERELFNSKLLYALLALLVFSLLNIFLVAKRFDESFLILIGLVFFFYFLFLHTSLRPSWHRYLLISFASGVYFVGFINLTVASFEIIDLSANSLYNSWQQYSIIDIQKIYYAFYLNLAYLFIVDELVKSNMKFKVISIVAICAISLLLLWYTGSLSGIGLLMVLSFLIVVYHVIPKYISIVSNVMVVLPLLIFIALTNPTVQNVFSKIDGENSRIRNFNTNKELVSQAPIFGYGLGKEFEIMQAARKPRSWEFKNKYHAHNQYFEFLLGGGVLLVLLFFYFFFMLYERAIKNRGKHLLPIGFCVSIVFVFLIESIFRRHHGVLFFSFFFMLFIHYLKNDNISVTLSKEIE